jgi:hypothetical protein
MKSSKTTARIVGALFLIAIVVSIVGGTIIDSVPTTPDYLGNLSRSRTQVILGVLLELLNGLSVIGIAVLLFPVLKLQDEGLALGYVALRIIEAVIVVAAVISPVGLIALSEEVASAGTAGASGLQAISTSFLAVRALLVGQIMGIFFCLGALLLFYLLYRSKLVPRFISVWGFIGVALVLAWNLLELFGIHISFGMVLALPMIANEMVLAIWLIVKGFEPSALASLSGQTSPDRIQ